MALDPQIRALLDAAAEATGPDVNSLTPEEARVLFESAPTPPRPDGLSVVDYQIPGPRGPLAIREYRPADATEHRPPAVVFLHGSGWVLCSLDTHDSVVAQLALASKCVWFSVDYGLAPENRFPAGLEDAYAAVAWVAEHAGDRGADGGRLGIVGDSAGGNLAAVVCDLAARRGGPQIRFQLLAYPVVDLDFSVPSYAENDAYGLNEARMRWYSGHYLGPHDDPSDWRVSPILSDRPGDLPRTHVLAAGFDVLRDGDLAYARRLAEAGAEVTWHVEQSAHHGFWNLPVEIAYRSLADCGSLMGDTLRAVSDTR